jgi:hypothetical protein
MKTKVINKQATLIISVGLPLFMAIVLLIAYLTA